MSAVQPDLFGDLDRAEAERALWAEPATCPSCGTTEPNGWMLNNNHGYRPGETGICGWPAGEHPIFGTRCVAQHLVTNHITYYVRHPDPARLAERMERGRALGLDVDAIIAAARSEGGAA